MKQVTIHLCCLFMVIGLSGCATLVQPVSPSTPTVNVTPTVAVSDDAFPTVLDAKLTRQNDGTFTTAVTISSPYDTPQRYADGWRVVAPDGTLLGEHTLLHDHATEQPFTRTQSGVMIPNDVQTVTIEGRDLVNGYGGTSITVEVP